MTVKGKELGAVLTEEITCAALLMVWVIVMDGKLCGRITSRRAVSNVSSCVAFKMFKKSADSEVCEKFICGYANLGGSQRVSTEKGIAEILERNRRGLEENFGVEIPDVAELTDGRWKDCFRRAGYDVISVF